MRSEARIVAGVFLPTKSRERGHSVAVRNDARPKESVQRFSCPDFCRAGEANLNESSEKREKQLREYESRQLPSARVSPLSCWQLDEIQDLLCDNFEFLDVVRCWNVHNLRESARSLIDWFLTLLERAG